MKISNKLLSWVMGGECELDWNRARKTKDKNFIAEFKNMLPDGFLQRRIVCTNYKALRNIIKQRKNHKLPQWKEFCDYLKNNLKYAVYADV